MSEPSRSVRAQRAFDRAVERERHAIQAHDEAVVLQEQAAAWLEQLALGETDPVRADDLTRRAEIARDLCRAAQARAAEARRRLDEEGVHDHP